MRETKKIYINEYQPSVISPHIDIRVVSRKDPQGLVLVGGPEARGAVVAGRREVVAMRRPAHVPHRPHVPAVHHQARPALQRPQSHCGTK